jgi:hypothetical protein
MTFKWSPKGAKSVPMAAEIFQKSTEMESRNEPELKNMGDDIQITQRRHAKIPNTNQGKLYQTHTNILD